MELVTGRFVLPQKAFSQMKPRGRVRKERLLQPHLSHPPNLSHVHLAICKSLRSRRSYRPFPGASILPLPGPLCLLYFSFILLVIKKGSGHPFQCVHGGCFPTPLRNPWTPAWGTIVQLHSGTIYKERASDPTG